jgi:hypothetical protein
VTNMLNLSLFLKRCRLARVLCVVAVFLCAIGVQAQSSCSAPANAIVAENCLPGNPDSEWDIPTGDAGDLTIQGFADNMSIAAGGTINFKIDTKAAAYTINIYRIGYYGGMGARKVATITPSVPLPQTQPACLTNSATSMTDCGNWAVSASWTVPSTATSGVYIAHLTRTDTHGSSHIIFVVRNDASTSPIMFQTSDTTWQAYNYYGNGSLYGPGSPDFALPNRTYAVSYNRPFLTRSFDIESDTFFFGAEFAMVQWLEANGYDVTYTTGVDSARYGSLILNHKVFMDTGHDEYVSGPARTNIEAARAAGVNLAFFSGNEVFWKTRWGNSIDPSNTAYRSLICYKETLAFAKLDPQDPPTWTGTWRDPSFSPPADGGRPENALTGTIFLVNGTGSDNEGDQTIKVPQADGKMRFWRNTAVANLAAGGSYTLPTGTLGYEWDVDADNGARPAGAWEMSTSTYQLTTDQLLDYGATYGAGTATHHLMMYRASSGALVFGAGTINWSWGLNSNHDNPFGYATPNPDINMEQATVNLFADMGVQPATIQPGLTAATASTDKTPPSSVILSPASGATVTSGSSVTVSGTATDAGGGVVAGVEVSVDGGNTWHPATGRGTWSYTWTPSVLGAATIWSRAVDDSGNLETPTSNVSVTAAPQTCPCTIFGSEAPNLADSGDAGSIEVGVKFTSDSNGSILGIRFYKSAANTGTHVGHIWSSSGALLGTATFTAETGSGWQQVNFAVPIAITANTTYIASYFAPAGHYAGDSFYFEEAGHDNPPLHALANGVEGADGIYIYASTGTFPTQTYNSTNYWVDVIFSSANTYSITGSITGGGGAGALVSLNGPETTSVVADASGNFAFDGVINGTYTVSASNPGVTITPASQVVIINSLGVSGVAFTAKVTNPLSISGTISGGAGATVTLGGVAAETTTADVNGNYSFTGLLPGAYTVTPSETNYIFNPSTIAVTLTSVNSTSNNFTGQVCTCVSIFPVTAVPTVIDSGDSNAVELGVKFYADTSSYITGVRFYKAATNTGTHVGHLWSSAGVLLGTATFPGETASGWQQGYFPTPIPLTADTDYVVSYLAPAGHYSADANYFATAGVNNPPLHALANGVLGGDGVYLYGASGGFPTNSYNSTNYWVDLVFEAQPYTISGTISGPGGPGATVTLSGTSQATTVADANGNYQFNDVFGGTFDITPSATGAIFSPSNQPVTLSTANLTGINFTSPTLCPCDTVWPLTAKPTTADAGDTASIEVGTKIKVDSTGYVLGVRFYKAPLNTGTHIGNLWGVDGTAAGTLLGSATAVDETASGWQQVLFATPVPVQAATTYVASYFAPVGHYSGDSSFFATANVDNPPLHALANGIDGSDGIFTYGATSSYPTSTYNSANYWVDLIYAPSSTYTIAGTISGPAGAGANVSLGGTSSATTTADANGNYSFSGLADGTYTVTPTTTLPATPSSQSITINGAHALNVDFVTAPASYAVSGTVSGSTTATLTLTGSSTQTATVNASGAYVFPAVQAGTYTLTPSAVGLTFTPASLNVTVTSAAVSNLNFTATPVTYSISGTIAGAPGATVLVTGAASSSTVADSSGNYTLAGLISGSYTVVPTPAAGLITSPPNLILTIGSASITGANFSVPSVCPCDTIFQPAAVPTVVDYGDTSATEVGVKFETAADSYIAGVRFYKAPLNVGTHLGRIWSSTGVMLGTATFANESASGWQQVMFSSPVPVSANTVYTVSYFAPSGHYSADVGYFSTSGVNNPPLDAPAYGVQGPNGVYLASATGGFPSLSYNSNAANYWVDVIDTPTSTYSITGTITGAGAAGASVALSGASSATVSSNASGNFSFSGLANGTYTVTPTETGYTFTPASQQVTINNGHMLGLSFSSSALGYAISGTITGPGASGATVTLSGTSSGSVVTSASGTFSFAGLANGSYTVAASNAGYTFTPASQAVTISSANATASFSSTANTYTLSGTISGAGGSGATVTLSGGGTGTTTATSAGAFSFTGLANGSYTVSVSNAGYTFTPASQAVTISSANATASFSSTANTYTLSGTISGTGGSGATVTLSGAASATTTATSAGAFSFTGLASGSYTVTVSRTGYKFTPASQSVTISTANVTTTFTSAAIYAISGTLSGTGGAGATVTLSGAASATTVASGTGTYSFAGLVNGSYVVTPTHTGYVFTPVSATVALSGANATANFTAATAYTLSGTISGPGGPGATVTLSGKSAGTAVASGTGTFSFTGLASGSYTVAVARTGYTFTPASQTATITSSNVSISFTSVATYTLTGTISGSGGSGATVTLSGARTATATANASGVYSFAGLPAGSYTVRPAHTGFTFTPASSTVTISTANVIVNFTAVQNTYTISGTITGTGKSGATVTLSGAKSATTTSGSGGAYSFTGVVNGSYTVTVTKSGFTFSPTKATVTVNGANVTANFTSS